MDVSKEFIEMCEKAEEIQKKWKHEDCDHFYGYLYNAWDKSEDKGFHFISYCEDGYYSYTPFGIDEFGDRLEKGKRVEAVWLPRQDQLQAMITTNGYFRFSLIELFYKFASNIFKDSKCLKLNSMEKMWLAFVLHQKYHKKWSEGEWVNEKE